MNHASFIICLSMLVLASCKTPSILVTEEQLKGDEFSNTHHYEEAISHYKNSLSESRKLGVYRNIEMEADICRKIAYAYNVQGNFQEALNYNYFAYRRDSSLNNELAMIEDLRALGKTHLYMGDFKNGCSYLDTVISKSTQLESSIKSTNLLSIAETNLTLAQLKSVLGKFSESTKHCNEALEIFQGLNNKAGIMECNLLLGRILAETGSPLIAAKLLQHSTELATELDLNISRQFHMLANLAEAKADYQDAISYRLLSIDEAQKAGIIPQEIWALLKTGDSYALLGDHERAERYYQKAIALKDSTEIISKSIEASSGLRDGKGKMAISYYKEIGSEISLALAYLRRGDLLLQKSNYGFALGQYQKAQNIFNQLESKEGIAKSALMMAEVYIKMQQYEQAESLLKQVISQSQQAENLWRYHYLYGLIYEVKDQKDEAIRAWKTSIDIIESIRGNITVDELKSAYINNKIVVYDKLINLFMMNNKSDKAFEYAERARARSFLDLIGNKELKFHSKDNDDLVNMESSLRSQIQSLTKLLHQNDLGINRGIDRAIVYEELQKMRSEYENLLIEIKLSAPKLASLIHIEPLNSSNLTVSSNEKSAFVVYWIGEKKSFAWIIIDNKTQSIEIPYSESELISLVQECRDMLPSSIHNNSMEDFLNSDDASKLKKAYNMLYAPLEEYLVGIEQICFVPHKVLHLLPFQSLLNNNNEYLIENKSIYYSPSISSLSTMLANKADGNENLLCMALGELELFGFDGLPGTTREVQNIVSQYPKARSLYENDAKETFFKENAEQFGQIHLATHGFMDQEQPLFSFLLLSPDKQNDGLLTVAEIFELRLKADLVVLSACQTGLGKLSHGDDVVGLSRAMLYAGASNVIVSLWSVADKETSFLMSEFHRYTQTYDPVKALQLAQISTLNKYKNPFYWAPFQLIGSAQ